jgi:hypothetical protein
MMCAPQPLLCLPPSSEYLAQRIVDTRSGFATIIHHSSLYIILEGMSPSFTYR